MQLTPMRRFIYRQLILPQEYQQKLIRVKQIIQEITMHKPSSEVTLMCLIDEFLNQNDTNDNEEPSGVKEGSQGAVTENSSDIRQTEEGGR